ncbi:MAG TPA: phytanoyl-CoA dioxygenase family protein [Tepidisphaeraceae bacterium]|jgi:hypothetical protein
MTAIASFPRLLSRGEELDPEQLGWLRESTDLLGDGPALRQRIAEDGYLLLRGALRREEVLDARREMCQRVAKAGWLQPGTDPMEAIPAKDAKLGFSPDLAKDNAPLKKVLYSGPMMDLFGDLLGGAVRHFDFTWIRSYMPGLGTPPHCDVVYMGRGTHNVYTAWTPMGDVSLQLGGLMLLENSFKNERLRHGIKEIDVDAYCTNRTGRSALDMWERGQGGWFKAPPPKLRNSMGGRWLTTEYRAGDVLIFGMYMIHASLDNTSDRPPAVRFSTDTRYQLASEPVDERWIGENPIAHGKAGKRGKIC